MAAVVKIIRILVLCLIVMQGASIFYKDTATAIATSDHQSTTACSSSSAYSSVNNTSVSSGIKSILYNSGQLELPAALLTPIPSFQFAFVEDLACFLFLIFYYFFFIRINKTIQFFTNTYFHTLFLSVILINAP